MLIGNPAENRLLSSLPAEDLKLMRRHLRNAVLASQSILFETDDHIGKAYFPHRGAISLVTVLASGQMVENATIGRDGMLGGFAALDGQPATCRAIVHIEGTASTIDMESLRQIARARNAVEAMLLRHERALLAQTQQVAACNASHALEARLCRWLLRARDACGGTTLSSTQEAIAEMLSVRRTSISLVAHTLQQAGLIRTRRGHIEILNEQALRDSACECYVATAARHERLFTSTGPQGDGMQAGREISLGNSAVADLRS